MAVELEPTAGPWPELVFHVLAHAAGTAALPSSVADAAYVRFAADHLGPAEERTLAEDARLLGALLRDHQELSAVQLLAWLFRDLERAGSTAGRDLGALAAGEVDAPELLEPLTRCAPAVELLRCAVELERPWFERLPAPTPDLERLQRELDRAVAVAPGLADATVALVRSLRLRGRVRAREIWVGVPDPGGPSVEHVVWQACHEASVREVALAARGGPEALTERGIEHAAFVLLQQRAERAGREAEHQRWRAHFGQNAPPLALASLSGPTATLVQWLVAQR